MLLVCIWFWERISSRVFRRFYLSSADEKASCEFMMRKASHYDEYICTFVHVLQKNPYDDNVNTGVLNVSVEKLRAAAFSCELGRRILNCDFQDRKSHYAQDFALNHYWQNFAFVSAQLAQILIIFESLLFVIFWTIRI